MANKNNHRCRDGDYNKVFPPSVITTAANDEEKEEMDDNATSPREMNDYDEVPCISCPKYNVVEVISTPPQMFRVRMLQNTTSRKTPDRSTKDDDNVTPVIVATTTKTQQESPASTVSTSSVNSSGYSCSPTTSSLQEHDSLGHISTTITAHEPSFSSLNSFSIESSAVASVNDDSAAQYQPQRVHRYILYSTTPQVEPRLKSRSTANITSPRDDDHLFYSSLVSSTRIRSKQVKNRHRNSFHFITLVVQHQRYIIILSALLIFTLTLTTIAKFHQMVFEYTIHNKNATLISSIYSTRNTRTKPKKKKQKKNAVDSKLILAKLLGTDKPLSNITWRDLHFQQEQHMAPSCSTPVHPSNITFTLVTQVSEDRLWMLTQHCHRWAGPISAAVFTDYSADKIQQIITTENGAYGRCQQDQVTVATLIKGGIPDGEYPVNALRNLALRGVQTTHLFYADVDFWPSDNLYDTLRTTQVTERLATDAKLALVIPAFQMNRHCDDHGVSRDTSILCRLSNMDSMPQNKQNIIDMVHASNVSAFDPTNKGGHGSTRYAEWYLQNQGEVYDIPCISSNRYEPYVAVRYCQFFPPFQEVFTGYGKNKMTVSLVAMNVPIFYEIDTHCNIYLCCMISCFCFSSPPLLFCSANYANETYWLRIFPSRWSFCRSLSSPLCYDT